MFQRLHSHKKSASCTALPVPSASSSTSTQSQPIPSNYAEKKKQQRKSQQSITSNNNGNNSTKNSTSSSTRSSSSSSIQSNRSIHHDWAKTTLPYQEENITVRSGLSSLLKHKSSPFPLPSVCLFSKEALQNEYADNQEIVPYVYPSSVPVDQICMLVSVLESLFRTVDEILLNSDDEEKEDQSSTSNNSSSSINSSSISKNQDDDHRIIGLGTFKVTSWNLSDDSDMVLGRKSNLLVRPDIKFQRSYNLRFLLRWQQELKMTTNIIDTDAAISTSKKPLTEPVLLKELSSSLVEQIQSSPLNGSNSNCLSPSTPLLTTTNTPAVTTTTATSTTTTTTATAASR
ncbi:hypothetical protein INT45_011483 [Circinella minor]|uniref:Uncharacterized protein n=1 Tax=Circinella minor TaxID=1195481 RepID=A0A8H7VMW5_9FUNG|nr:hypothetical protein INT45_011483 [Circinella minor]